MASNPLGGPASPGLVPTAEPMACPPLAEPASPGLAWTTCRPSSSMHSERWSPAPGSPSQRPSQPDFERAQAQPPSRLDSLAQDSTQWQAQPQDQSPGSERERESSPSSMMGSGLGSDAGLWNSTLLAPSDFAGSEPASPALTNRDSIDTAELTSSSPLVDRYGNCATAPATERGSPALAETSSFNAAVAAGAAANSGSPAGLNSLLTTPLSRGSSLLSPLTPPIHRTPSSHTVVRALPFPSLASPPSSPPPTPRSDAQPLPTGTQPEGVEAWPDSIEVLGLEQKPLEEKERVGNLLPTLGRRVSHGILEAGSRLREQAECAEGVPGYPEAPFESRASSEGSTGSVWPNSRVAAGGDGAGGSAPAATATPSATTGAPAARAAAAGRQAGGSSNEEERSKGDADDRAQGDCMVSVAKRRAFFEQGQGQDHTLRGTREVRRANRPSKGSPLGHPAGSSGSGNSYRSDCNRNANNNNNNEDNKSDDCSQSPNSSDSRGNGRFRKEANDGAEREADSGPLLSSQGGYYEEESGSSSSSCCTSRLRTEDGALIAEEEAPGARGTEDEEVPGAGLPGLATEEELGKPEITGTRDAEVHGSLVTDGGEAESQVEEGGVAESQAVEEEGAQVVRESLGSLGLFFCDSAVAGGEEEPSQAQETCDSTWAATERPPEASVAEDCLGGSMVAGEAQVEAEGISQGDLSVGLVEVEAIAAVAEERSRDTQERSHESQVAHGEELVANVEEGGAAVLAPAKSTVTKGGAVAVADKAVAGEQVEELGADKEGGEESRRDQNGRGAIAEGLHVIPKAMRDSASTWGSSELPALVESRSASRELRSSTVHVPVLSQGPEDLEPAEVIPSSEGQSLPSHEGSGGSRSSTPEASITVTALNPRGHSASLLHKHTDAVGAPVVCLDKDGSTALRGGAALIPVVTRDCRVCSEAAMQQKVEREADIAYSTWQGAGGVPLVSRCTNTINNCSSRYRHSAAAQKVACKAPIKTAWSHWTTTATLPSGTGHTSTAECTVERASQGTASSFAGSVQLAHQKTASGAPVVDREGTLHCDAHGTHQPPEYPGLAFGEWCAVQSPSLGSDLTAEVPVCPGPASGVLHATKVSPLGSDASAHRSEDVRGARGAPTASDELQSAEPASLLQPDTPGGVPGGEVTEGGAWGVGLSLGVAAPSTSAAGERREGWEVSSQGALGEYQGLQPVGSLGLAVGPGTSHTMEGLVVAISNSLEGPVTDTLHRADGAPAAHAPGASHKIGSLACDSPLGLSLGLSLEPPGSVAPAVQQTKGPVDEPEAGAGAGAGTGAGVEESKGPGEGAGAEAEASAAAGTGAHGTSLDSAVVVEMDVPSFQAGEWHTEATPAPYWGTKGVGRCQVPSDWDAAFPTSFASPSAKNLQVGGAPISPRSLFLKLQSPEPGGPSDEEEHTIQYSKECTGASDTQYNRGGGVQDSHEGGAEAGGKTMEKEAEEGGGVAQGVRTMQGEGDEEEEEGQWALPWATEVTRYLEKTAAFGVVTRVAPHVAVLLNKATEAALLGVLMSFTSVLVATLVNSASQDGGFLPS